MTVNSSTGGQIAMHVTTTLLVGGVSITRATGDGLSGDSADALKTYVDAQIKITPLTPTNKVGDADGIRVDVVTGVETCALLMAASGVTVTATATASNGATITSAGGI